MAINKCVICGTEFEARRDAKYCSHRCCEKNRRLHGRVRKKTLSPNGHYKRIAKNGNMKSIAELDAKAKALGMSYGQYEAMIRMRKSMV